jgi:DHA2 family multidrug resistance protein
MNQALSCENITSLERWMITFTVMMITFIEVLDTTIVNVSIPQMMGQLEANSEQITWVLTSFIVSTTVVIPLTGFISNRLGYRKLLLVAIVGFLLTSMLCGASTSLAEIVFFRVLQGMFGATLIPLSQTILSNIFPKKDQGKAMAIWGVGIMVAPVLGPTIGGYITETLNWRWVFYINIPFCLIAYFLTLEWIPLFPGKKEHIDWIGLTLMTIGIGALQIFLDRGNTNDWFNSKSIIILLVVWIVFLTAFIIRGLHIENNIINLRLLKNHNLMASTAILTIFGAVMFGVVAIMPMMLEYLMGYTALMAGLFMAPRGIATAIGIITATKLMSKIDTRWIIVVGILLSSYSSFLMCRYSLNASFVSMLWPTLLLGFASGLFFSPLSTAALSTLKESDTAEGAGLFNFGRSLGASIGISLLSTLITRETQINWNGLVEHTQSSGFAFQHWMQLHHASLSYPLTLQPLVNDVARNAMMIAFIDAYYAVGIVLLLMLPLVLIMKKFDPTKISATGH